MAFPQFQRFPVEIQSMVLAQCMPNDQICMRLTCKTLYVSPPLRCPDDKIYLVHTDKTTPLCGHTQSPEWRSGYQDHQCHAESYAGLVERNKLSGKATRPMKPKCRTAAWMRQHCECYTRENTLHIRLRSWFPQDLRYCGTCEKFTVRKKGHAGRCYHGRAKPRSNIKGNLWTRTRRRGYRDGLWKMWFNNQAWNKWESRLREGYERKGTERYGLRPIRGVAIDTRDERDNRSMIIR
ncbi:hypothetical protein BKA65DRAFT_388263 [Rhexocercosporidium sp. MPI-PUGE-AT-0058]|nr:hypothetical protein BKA65DRAFT_388263 [Rhexocercosporidium sp. MPI-PUGE-AT-0058]